MAPISQGAAQLCVDRCQANAERLVAGQRVSAEHIFLRWNWSRNWTESTGVILGEAFFCYLKSIMYLDFPTLPSCNTVCLSFSCQAKLHVSYDCCDLWYVWTRQMKCYLQSHLKILDRCLHLVPHPSCPLSEVQFVALCHLSWRGTRNHNNTNQQSSACLLRIEIPLRGIRIKQAVMNSLHGCRTGLLSTMGQLCSSSPANPLGAHWHAESANFHSH